MNLIKLTLTFILLALSIAAQGTPTPPKAIELPKVVTASEISSLKFRNSLLEIQALRSQAEALTARANLLQSGLGEQIGLIQKEGKIDETKYTVMRSANGAFVLSDEGLLQFQLREAKKE